MRKISVPLKRYASPDYLRELCNRVEQCYFSEDRDWSCIEAIFTHAIKEMEARKPRMPVVSADPMKASRRRAIMGGQ